MPIIRCSAQSKQTLEEKYLELSTTDDKISYDTGVAMISVIELINFLFRETNIFGLTSLYHLYLLEQDDDRSPSFIRIEAHGRELHIFYKLPEDKQPWAGAAMTGRTMSLKEFEDYLIIAMSESEGWTDSKELKHLYEQVKRKRI